MAVAVSSGIEEAIVGCISRSVNSVMLLLPACDATPTEAGRQDSGYLGLPEDPAIGHLLMPGIYFGPKRNDKPRHNGRNPGHNVPICSGNTESYCTWLLQLFGVPYR